MIVLRRNVEYIRYFPTWKFNCHSNLMARKSYLEKDHDISDYSLNIKLKIQNLAKRESRGASVCSAITFLSQMQQIFYQKCNHVFMVSVIIHTPGISGVAEMWQSKLSQLSLYFSYQRLPVSLTDRLWLFYCHLVDILTG